MAKKGEIKLRNVQGFVTPCLLTPAIVKPDDECFIVRTVVIKSVPLNRLVSLSCDFMYIMV